MRRAVIGLIALALTGCVAPPRTTPDACLGRLPAEVGSTLGPVPVRLVPGLKDEEHGILYGRYMLFLRQIDLRLGMAPQTSWQTLFHERVHVELSDAGVQLEEQVEDRVADVIATAIVRELLARCAAAR